VAIIACKGRHDLRKPDSFKQTLDPRKGFGRARRLQFRKSNAIVREEGKTPPLVERDFGDRFPLVPVQNFVSAEQVQFAGLEQSFS